MDPLLKKMTWKDGMNIQVWNTPEELSELIAEWTKDGLIDPSKAPDFMLAFLQKKTEVKKYFFEMQAKAKDDEQIWLAYPKKTSKKYKSEINRDSGWGYLAQFDYEPVRQIAINDDWSALRFRKTKFVKNMTRQFSLKDQK